MFKIVKYLKSSKWVVVLIVGLLVLQAVCELSLPQYTSGIVDVGIQQGGIADVAPTKMRGQTYEDLSLLMTEAEKSLVDAHYEPDADGNMVRTTNDPQEVEALNEALSLPIVMMAGMQQSGEMDMETVRAMVAGGMLSHEQILAMRESGTERLAEVNESLLAQQAILFVRNEYEALGMDLGAIQTNYLLVTGAKMLGITLVMVAAAIVVGLLSARTSAKIGMELREGVFHRVLSFSSGDMGKFSTASLITRSTNDIQQVQMVSVMLLRMVIYSPILGIGGVLKVSSTRTGMGWIIAVAVAAVMALVLFLLVVAMPKFRRMPTLIDRINLVAREILTGLPVIRAFSREKHEEERFDEANKTLMKNQLFTNRVMSFMMPMMMLIMNGVTLLIVWFGAKGIDLGNLQVGDMMAFITYTMQIVMSFLTLSMISVILPRAAVSAGRIDEVLETQPSIEDGGNPAAYAGKNFKGIVSFENVSFRYPQAQEDVLCNISFTAMPGKTTAIIGGTGSGKSTLLNLIPRFFDVTEGRITMDGVDIRDMTQHDLRALLGYVPQKGVLFSGDIASNIKYGGEDISDEEMRRAAQIAQADDFIEEKADKYLDPIAQGGSNVSGGQKQRLSIARAIAKNPKVLLFDDSFSALDYRTDVTLRRALSENVKDATVIIVAQRISTILHADQILVLEDGMVVGKGTHEELMQSSPEYQEIAHSQLSEAELSGGIGA